LLQLLDVDMPFLSDAPSEGDCVRVLVVGDTGVGKSSLVHLLCSNKVLQNPSPTIGSQTEVKLHTFNNRSFFVEFFDIGGSPKYELSRSVFYSQVDGLILMYDLTNKKSFYNLRKWLRGIAGNTPQWKDSDEEWQPGERRQDLVLNGLIVPILYIGNKKDLTVKEILCGNTNDNVIEKAERIYISATDTYGWSVTVEKFNSFFDKVIWRRFFDSKHNRRTVLPSPVTSKSQLHIELQQERTSSVSFLWK